MVGQLYPPVAERQGEDDNTAERPMAAIPTVGRPGQTTSISPLGRRQPGSTDGRVDDPHVAPRPRPAPPSHRAPR
ncbi:MAG: hypothetical protein AAF547_24450, partial [Actinomycetota bacterium]